MLGEDGLASNLHGREVVCHLSWELLSDKAKPMEIVIDIISSPSIYKSLSLCLWKASASAGEVRILGVQEIEVARAFFASTKLNLSEEILVTKEREACSPSQQALQDLCS